MIVVSDEFRPRNILEYPPGNKQTFEEYFFDEYTKSNINMNRIYIPIFWTNYYICKNYGKGDLSKLQSVLDSLDRSKKYFTIIQYDDNILNDLKDLDILIFAQGGYGIYKEKSYVIPLNCQSNNQIDTCEKDIFASFVGRITHPIRNLIFKEFGNKKDYFISDPIDYKSYKNIMSRSIFSLCPRGYGLTSFRICESLQVGSIPVYIYDEDFIPFEDEIDFERACVLITENKIDSIESILSNILEEKISDMREYGEYIYNNYYRYESLYNRVIEKIKKI